MGSAGGWASIPSDLLTEILANPRYLGSDPTVALTLSHVCRDWREAILGDRWALEKLKYRRLTRRVPDETVPPLPAIYTSPSASGLFLQTANDNYGQCISTLIHTLF